MTAHAGKRGNCAGSADKSPSDSISALEHCPDWRERTHIVPGCGRAFLLRLAWFLSRQRIPWLHWSEHSWPKRRSRLTFYIKRLYGLLVDRNALGALAIGELARQEFIRWGIRAEKIRFLPYAVSAVRAFTQTEEADTGVPGIPRFLFLGSLCENKGIDLLLAAMSAVLAECPNAQLELAGRDRSGGGYRHEAEQLGISDAVNFSGVVKADVVGTVLSRCDVLVLPSRHDGWGVVLNEAASAGKAIIASDRCGAAFHVVRPGVNGFRVPAGDQAALRDAMLAYCTDPGLAERHGRESLRVFQDFTPARNALRFERALRSLQDADNGSGLAWEA